MKFKIDQNLPVEFGPLLQQAGHDAATVLDEQLSPRGGEIRQPRASPWEPGPPHPPKP